ncbi:growth-regulating factor 8 [Mercurialis annua]|uniref:growth-regulating factor 8 n=1 Tax=Mercurialis annua TaxID=3986 RepID=UPI00215FED8E|nr:growth-regulating factor 8 [Mercurialis annua]
MSRDHYHQGSTQFSSGGFDGGAGGGPMFYGRSNHGFGDIYNALGTDAVVAARSKFYLSGEMTPSSMNMRVPFTAAQWQELERQTIIYKYMMAAVPVPPELLIPITRTSPSRSYGVKGSLELGISSCGGSDPEPWRCKRTDGKKWRCSRDVAPDLKYCERHSHKSRPRSRKPVELHTDSMANNHTTTSSHLLDKKSHFPTESNSHFSIPPTAMVSAAPTSFDQTRNLEWFLKGETVPVPSNSNQEWLYLKQDRTKDGGGDEKLYDYRQGQLDSNSYLNLRENIHSLQAHRLNDNCSLLLSPKSTTLSHSSQTQAQETRHFLDAWSSALRESTGSSGIGDDRCSVSSSEKVAPVSTLTLSMSGGSETVEENENAQTSCGFGIMSSDKEDVGVLRPQWMMNHGSWMSSPPGGPLAEALCLGISNSARADSNLASSHGSSFGTNDSS